MLTEEDKIFLIEHAKNGTTPFVNTVIDTWEENGVRMAEYCSNFNYSRVLYRGVYQDCIEWKSEAEAYYTDTWERFREEEEKEYRRLGISI